MTKMIMLSQYTSLILIVALCLAGCGSPDKTAIALHNDESVVGNGGDDLTIDFQVAIQHYLTESNKTSNRTAQRQALSNWLEKNPLPLVSNSPYQSSEGFYWDEKLTQPVSNSVGWFLDRNGKRCVQRLVYESRTRRWVIELDEFFWRSQLAVAVDLESNLAESTLFTIADYAKLTSPTLFFKRNLFYDPALTILANMNRVPHPADYSLDEKTIKEAVEVAIETQLVPHLQANSLSGTNVQDHIALIQFLSNKQFDLELVNRNEGTDAPKAFQHANTLQKVDDYHLKRLTDGHGHNAPSRIVRDSSANRLLCQSESEVWIKYLGREKKLTKSGLIYLLHEAMRLAYFRGVISNPDDYFSTSRKLLYRL